MADRRQRHTRNERCKHESRARGGWTSCPRADSNPACCKYHEGAGQPRVQGPRPPEHCFPLLPTEESQDKLPSDLLPAAGPQAAAGDDHHGDCPDDACSSDDRAIDTRPARSACRLSRLRPALAPRVPIAQLWHSGRASGGVTSARPPKGAVRRAAGHPFAGGQAEAVAASDARTHAVVVPRDHDGWHRSTQRGRRRRSCRADHGPARTGEAGAAFCDASGQGAGFNRGQLRRGDLWHLVRDCVRRDRACGDPVPARRQVSHEAVFADRYLHATVARMHMFVRLR